MEEDFAAINTEVLVDMLASHTTAYTQLMLNGTKEEFEMCKVKITLIQQELNSRKPSENNTNISDTDIEFTSETT